jgi:2'-5' RNA ligase
VRRRLEKIQRLLRDAPLDVRWTPPETIHLTFKFLGEIELGRRQAIEAALVQASAAARPFHLRAEGVGTFPPTGAPKVVWCGVRGDLAAAARLRAAVEDRLAESGFPRETKAYHPHLTLGRVRGRPGGTWRDAVAPHLTAQAGEFSVDAVVLFESLTLPQGAVHRARARFPLASGGA